MKKRFVVIGASASSIGFTSNLRRFDKKSEIICITEETDLPYNRCLLADLLTDEIDRKKIDLKSKKYFEDNSIDLRLNSKVTKIDPKNNLIKIGTQKINYHYLFIGTGSKPYIPEFAKIKTDGLFTFHTANDIERISSFIKKNQCKKGIIIGAGINGLEAASSLIELSLDVEIIERSNQILSTMTNKEVADQILDKILKSKAKPNFLLNQLVHSIKINNNNVSGVTLNNGTSRSADIIIITTGNQLNNEILQETGIKLDQGSISVDTSMRTNIKNIFSGGDICKVQAIGSKDLIRSCTWSDAMLQGLTAASQFGSKPKNYDGAISFRKSELFGIKLSACGETNSQNKVVSVKIEKDDDSIKIIFKKEEKLIGFVLFGNCSDRLTLRKILLTKS